MNNKYTKDQKNYIKELRKLGFSWAQVAEQYNDEYGEAKTHDALRFALRGEAAAPKPSLPAREKRRLDSSEKKINLMDKEYNCVLFIPDLHVPYHHKEAFDFLELVRDTYQPDLVINAGDECFPGDAEVFTNKGWVEFKDFTSDLEVMQIDDKLEGRFVQPVRTISKKYTGQMVERQHKNYYSLTTAGHDLVLQHPKTGKLIKQRADDERNRHYYVPRTVNYIDGVGAPLSDNQIRLMCMLSADFTFRERGDVYGCLKKERKVERALKLLEESGLTYSANIDSRGYHSIFIHKQDGLSIFSKEFNSDLLVTMSSRQRLVMLNELGFWDGYDDPTRDRVIYCSSLQCNIDFVMTLAHLSGVEASSRVVNSKYGESMQVSILYGKTGTRANSNVSQYHVDSLPVYCVTVPSGRILVRQKGSITVTGNCDKHAMSFHDSDPDLPSAGDELEEAIAYLEDLYQLFPEMHLVDSNHGSMHYRKGKHHGIPRKYLRDYGDILEAPKGWVWSHELNVNCGGNPVRVKHQFGKDVLKAAEQAGRCLMGGHFHEDFYVKYSANSDRLIWAATAGCLVDDSSLAFAYNNTNLKRPILGCMMVINGYPQLVPMILEKGGRWCQWIP